MSKKSAVKSLDVETREISGATSKSLKWLLVLDLLAILALVVGVSIQISKMEEKFSNLNEEMMRVKKELSDIAGKNISKRSTPMIVQQPLIANVENEGAIKAIHLEGAHSSQHIRENGRIGPWTTCSENNELIDLLEGNIEVQIKHKGLYFIYAQIYYLVSGASNSFEILTYKNNQTYRDHRTLAACSKSNGDDIDSDRITCYTGTAVILNANDKIYLNQIEQNRVIDFNKGYSYFGIIKMKEEK